MGPMRLPGAAGRSLGWVKWDLLQNILARRGRGQQMGRATMRSAAEEKQAQFARELEIDSSGGSTSSEGERQPSKREKTIVTDWRGGFVAAVSASGGSSSTVLSEANDSSSDNGSSRSINNGDNGSSATSSNSGNGSSSDSNSSEGNGNSGGNHSSDDISPCNSSGSSDPEFLHVKKPTSKEGRGKDKAIQLSKGRGKQDAKAQEQGNAVA